MYNLLFWVSGQVPYMSCYYSMEQVVMENIKPSKIYYSSNFNTKAFKTRSVSTIFGNLAPFAGAAFLEASPNVS